MKTEFWLITSALLVLACLIIIPPLLRKKSIKTFDFDQENAFIARQKLAELETQKDNQQIDIDQYQLQVAELEQSLADDLLLSSTNTSPQTTHQGRSMVFLILLALPIVSAVLYQSLSNPLALLESSYVPAQAKNNPHRKQIKSVDMMLDGLLNRLQNQPEDVNGWILLGKSYFYLGQAEQAANAYQKAYQITGDSPQLMLHYAEALSAVNRGIFNQQAQSLVFDSLKLSPMNGKALWFAGLIKQQQQSTAEAEKYWQLAEQYLDKNSSHYTQLQEKLTSLKTQPVAKTVVNEKPIQAQKQAMQSSIEPNPTEQAKWIAQGRRFKAEKNYQKAIDAFARADLLNSQHASAMLMYADSLVMHNNSRFPELAKKLIFKALTLDANNTTGLWLAGKVKAQEGSFNEALNYLYQAKTTLDVNSESYSILQSYINSLQQHSLNTGQKFTAEIAIKKQQAAEINILVRLAPELQQIASPDDSLFIYASALSGPQMPLAISRKKVADLPVEISLSDAQAMTPTMKLSQYQQVKLTARISKSGNALRQAGDLIGQVENIRVNDDKIVNILIDRQI